MNKHLKLVRELRRVLELPLAELGDNISLSDMAITTQQARLMARGSEVITAITQGEMGDILLALVKLSHCTLTAVAELGSELIDQPVPWRHDGSVLSVVKLLSERIARCASGQAEDYSGLYCVCVHLSRSFLNADFDKAFRVLDQYYLTVHTIRDLNELERLESQLALDVSECLYE